TITTDQRGIIRPQNLKCDIGAYEVVGTTVGNGTSGSCTEAALDSAVALGGIVKFNCPAPTTIILTSTINVSKSTFATSTWIDGTGQTVTISGNNAVEVFIVN